MTRLWMTLHLPLGLDFHLHDDEFIRVSGVGNTERYGMLLD